MSAYVLLQFLTQSLFVLIFLAVGLRFVRRPSSANVDTALLFGVASLIVVATWTVEYLHVALPHLLNAALGAGLMAITYLLLRLVDDFTVVPRPLLVIAEIGLALSAVILFVVPPPVPAWLALLFVVYVVMLTLYAALAIMRAAGRSSGVTRRRMQAVAAGSLLLGSAILAIGLEALSPRVGQWWALIAEASAVMSGVSYFVAFAPPRWLRRAWQEPELRAFLSRAAAWPRLVDTQAVVQELQHSAATSLRAPRAAIGLWDDETEVLRFQGGPPAIDWPPADGVVGRAFTSQRPIFVADAGEPDPTDAVPYRGSNFYALLAVPITVGDRRLGVLSAYGARASRFADDDLSLAQLLADQAAVILDSRALIDEAARLRARDEAARLKSDFLSAAAHELKTPLTAIILQAQLLERRAIRDPEAPADIQGIERLVGETQRLKRRVLDLLDVSRIEQGRLVGIREEVDLVALAREACASYSSAHHRCMLDAGGEIIGCFVRPRITQLIDNLLDNAVKFSPDGRDVQVKVWEDETGAHLTITDHGIGIPVADLPHLFDRFHRGTNVDDRRFAGMGLGLSMCRGIVEQHGGHIAVSSAGSGRGSTFHVTLPKTTLSSWNERGRDNALLASAKEAG